MNVSSILEGQTGFVFSSNKWEGRPPPPSSKKDKKCAVGPWIIDAQFDEKKFVIIQMTLCATQLVVTDYNRFTYHDHISNLP